MKSTIEDRFAGCEAARRAAREHIAAEQIVGHASRRVGMFRIIIRPADAFVNSRRRVNSIVVRLIETAGQVRPLVWLRRHHPDLLQESNHILL